MASQNRLLNLHANSYAMNIIIDRIPIPCQPSEQFPKSIQRDDWNGHTELHNMLCIYYHIKEEIISLNRLVCRRLVQIFHRNINQLDSYTLRNI